MATVKMKFKPSTLKNHEGSVFYQIIHERKVKQLFPGYHIFSSEWDERRCAVRIAAGGARLALLQSVRDHIRWDVDRLYKIINRFEEMNLAYSVEDIVEDFVQFRRECSLFNYMERLIAGMRNMGKIRTSETYGAALSSFRKFRNGKDMFLYEVSSEIMCEYEGWLRSSGLSANTVSFYMRILRATYHRAVDDGMIDDRHPFRRVYTGVDKTVKRALPINIIRKIKMLDLSLMPKLDYARDVFLLSFMLRGMSFVDMAFLKKSDLKNGCVMYRRRKTGQLLNVEWTADMQAILNKYPENGTEYLLPIIMMSGQCERSCYRNANAKINYGLKQIARMVGVKIPLTLYVARHSWASAARAKGIPLPVISEGMGHDSEATTRIYLASLDTSIVNKANRQILASI
ncbi:MAG: site-specific integrase [Muribaculaceae bacterium]|nr:site-specific integrase [Muribaculaceae bacterium]